MTIIGLLYQKDTILDDEGKLEDICSKDWENLNKNAVGKIRKWVDNTIYQCVANEISAYKVQSVLQELYQKRNYHNKVFLYKKIMYLRYQDGTSISKHLNVFQDILNKLVAMEIKLDEEIYDVFNQFSI